MTPEQVALVQKSFKSVSPIADKAADIFYDRLFELAPHIREMFPRDMKEQKKKLMVMLAMAVVNLHQIDNIVGPIRSLGVRHRKYGVREQHYDTVGEALLYALKMGLGDKFTPEVQMSWTVAYGVLADTMKEAAQNAA